MSARSNFRETHYHEQLSEFENQLGEQVDDEQMLLELHTMIASLLGGSDASVHDIRAILQRRFEAGKLRKETLQLAEEMLDRVVTVDDTMPVEVPVLEDKNNQPFIDTTVIPSEEFKPAPEQDRLQVGTVLRDRFLLQEEVGSGSLGVVFKALDRRLAETDSNAPYVAVKVLAPRLAKSGSALRALQQEAAKGRCLSHPNIVRFIDLDREEDLYFIVMEWLDGRSLASVLDDSRSAGLDLDKAMDIVRQVGRALNYAHRCGVVHADVKPGNIIITPSGQVKLFDFGVARVRQKEHEGRRTPGVGFVESGSMAFSSMQVITGEEPVPADDVFSLGCLMYRLVAGHRVFGPRNAAEAAAEGMDPQKPQSLSSRQWSALRKALSYSRVTRFPSTAEFIKALDGSAVEPEVFVTETRYAGADSESNSSWGFVGLVVIVLAGLGFLGKDRILELIPPVIPLLSSTLEVLDDTATLPEPGEAKPSEVEPSAAETVADEMVADIELEMIILPEIAEFPAADFYVPVDYSILPSPSLILTLPVPDETRPEAGLTLREDAAPVIVDLVRSHDIRSPLSLRFEEVTFSGNRSPWESQQYKVADAGVIVFEPGQERARTTISMSSDPLREPDRQVSLVLRYSDEAKSELGVLNLTLEDDDQRSFEAGLLPNTVAFAVSQVSVREQDSAVQIDLLRFKADNSTLNVNYIVRDVTATEGADYFASTTNTVTFSPGQRTARILIPLLQDTLPETDEAFMLELETGVIGDNRNIFRRIAVMIRDDDS